MARTTAPPEVQILNFFETGPIERVQILFAIVSDKLRERCQREGRTPARQADSGGKRQRRKAEEVSSRGDTGETDNDRNSSGT